MRYTRETRINRHRAKVAWAATIPFLIAFSGGLLFFFTEAAHWICFTMISAGATVGVALMGFSHKRIAIGPVVYHWKEDSEKLCVVIDNGEIWDKPLHRPIKWQRVLELMPGVYLLMGEPFMAKQSQMERSWDLFHPSITMTDEETTEES